MRLEASIPLHSYAKLCSSERYHQVWTSQRQPAVDTRSLNLWKVSQLLEEGDLLMSLSSAEQKSCEPASENDSRPLTEVDGDPSQYDTCNNNSETYDRSSPFVSTDRDDDDMFAFEEDRLKFHKVSPSSRSGNLDGERTGWWQDPDRTWYSPSHPWHDSAKVSYDTNYVRECSQAWNVSQRISESFSKCNSDRSPTKGSDGITNLPQNTTRIFATNNNESGISNGDVLWHDSAWSAPRKSSSSHDALADIRANARNFQNNSSYVSYNAAGSPTRSDVWPEVVTGGGCNGWNSNYSRNSNEPRQRQLHSHFERRHSAESTTNVLARRDRETIAEISHRGGQRQAVVLASGIRKESSDSCGNVAFACERDVSDGSADQSASPKDDRPLTGPALRATGTGSFPNVSPRFSLEASSSRVVDCVEGTCDSPRTSDHESSRSVPPDVFPTAPDDVLVRASGDDADVNLVGRSLNNFSMSGGKQREILRLLQERRRCRETNICDAQSKYSPEAKILNTSKNSLRSVNRARRQRLRKSDLGSWNVEIADGLVLEKVRYDPNWKRQNRVLCTTDQVSEYFRNSRKVVSHPKSVPIEGRPTEMEYVAKPTPPAVASSGDAVSTPTTGSSDVTECVDVAPQRHEREPSIESLESPVEDVVAGDGDSGDRNSNSSKPSDKPAKPLSKPMLDLFGDFDIYNIETTMPTIDWAAMEANLARAAKEDNWFMMRRNDREEIRRKLALGSDSDEYYCGEKVTKKPSLSTRLQSGMNLQICFMNETASDHESQCSDQDVESLSAPSPTSTCSSSWKSSTTDTQAKEDSLSNTPSTEGDRTPEESTISPSSPAEDAKDSDKPAKSKCQRPSFFFAKQRSWRLRSRQKHDRQDTDAKERIAAKEVEDFYTRQARLQAEARLALSQAKEMARMQMEIEKQKCKKSPIADIVGIPLPDNRHGISRQILMDMNISQLQVIVNDLHSHIETLNEDLVRQLMTRDDLHMEQDSMLVDIEDLTRYLSATNESRPSQQPVGKTKVCSK